MVLGHGHRKASNASHRSSNSVDDHEVGEDETVVDEAQGNVLSHIISQLRPGADLSRITLPTFILEPRSMLERITNFMAHPELLLELPTIEDPNQRFLAVTKFYLSGWHIKPPGVKKPLNPILGENFYGYWNYPDGTRGYYISEQTSHHPPKSNYFFMAPEHHIRIDGALKPRSKFLGNSAASLSEGLGVMRFLNRNERYLITQPNMYARGILFGKMKYELGDHAYVRCPELGLVADIEFKTKGWVSGKDDAIGGFIQDTNTGKHLYELSGFWNGQMHAKEVSTGQTILLFDAKHAKETYPSARPIEEQAENESQRLWKGVTDALKHRDHNTATDEKSRIEDAQRKEAAQRGDQEWSPRLFQKFQPGMSGLGAEEQDIDYILQAPIDGKTPEEKIAQIFAVAPVLPQAEMKSVHEPAASSQGSTSQRDTQPSGATSQQGAESTTQPSAAHQPVSRAQLEQALLERKDSTTGNMDTFVDASS